MQVTARIMLPSAPRRGNIGRVQWRVANLLAMFWGFAGLDLAEQATEDRRCLGPRERRKVETSSFEFSCLHLERETTHAKAKCKTRENP